MRVINKISNIFFLAVVSLIFVIVGLVSMTERAYAQLPSGATGVFGGIITGVKYCNCSHTYRITVLHPLSPRPKIVHYVPGRSIQCEYYNITRTSVWTLGIYRPVTPCLKWVWTSFVHFCVPVTPHPIADIVLTGTSRGGAPGSLASLEQSQLLALESPSMLSGLLTQLKLSLLSLPLPSFVEKFLLPELPEAFAGHRNSCPRPPPPQDFPPQPDRDPPPPPSDPQCSDGIDNDGDGLIDYPNDPECDNIDDNTESSGGGTCDAVTSGPCTEENLEGECSWDGNEASQICGAESGGIADRASAVDVVADNGDCGDGEKLPFSTGLFQINLTVHKIGGLNCPDAFEGKNFDAEIKDCELYKKCIDAANDPDTNIAKACDLYEGRGGNWADWSAAKVCELPTSGSGTPPIVSSGDGLSEDDARKQLVTMRQAIKRYPRLTTKLNKSKRRAVEALETLDHHMQVAVTLNGDIQAAYAKLLEEKASNV
ncbi:MAG: hypothetical protein IIC46_06515 [Planctomycetes bacterium]|nr:hypothetical protein [Planctomycetota bacterium]